MASAWDRVLIQAPRIPWGCSSYKLWWNSWMDNWILGMRSGLLSGSDSRWRLRNDADNHQPGYERRNEANRNNAPGIRRKHEHDRSQGIHPDCGGRADRG